MLGPYVCSTFVYVQSLSATHAFAMTWRFIYTFCRSFLTSYDMNYCGVIWPVLVGPLLGLLHVFLSIGYNEPVWSLDLYSCYFELSWSITLLMGSFGPFLSSWASSAHLLSLGILGPFSNSAFPCAFTNFFGLPWSNYHILHPWSSWVFHQPLTFLLHYFRPTVAHSYFSTSHNAYVFTTSFSGLL